jgi:hypothetical protein
VTVDPDHPPEDDCEITYTFQVGPPTGPGADLTAVFRMKPHFRLTVVGGGAPVVAPGNDLTLEVPAVDNVTLTADAKPIVENLPHVTAEIDSSGNLVVHVPATAAPGVGRVIVRDPANHAHKAQRAIKVQP